MDGKQLKNSILQWAIQGKLVPQNPKDEPASILLEKIRNAKENLVKQGKIKKKELENEPVLDEEIPFDIPQNWSWCRLEDIVWHLSDGTHKTPKYTESGIPFISVKNMSSGKLSFENTKFVSKKESDELNQRCNPEKGDLLLSKVGTTGIPVIVDVDVQFILFVSLALIKFFPNLIDSSFFVYLIKSPLVQTQVKEHTRGVGNKNWVLNDISKTVLAIPPLAEQKRIVAKLEQVLPLADEYGAAQEQLDKLNKELPETLKKSILQQAIQGKLVPQNPKDEPAQKLLERITAARGENSQPKGAKSKKFSPTSRIYCENGTWYEQIGNAEPKDISEDIPFEIPKNWTWSRLGYIGETITGSTPSKLNSNYLGSDIPFLSPGDISQFNSITSYNNQGLSNLGKSVARPVPAQTILQVCIGGSIGKSAIVDREVCFNQQINSITLKDIDYRYVYYVLQSKFFQDSIKAKATGTATPIINKSSWDRLLFPVAPLAEQKRIVTKLEQLFKVL